MPTARSGDPGRGWIDIFARRDITINNDAAGNYSVHANSRLVATIELLRRTCHGQVIDRQSHDQRPGDSRPTGGWGLQWWRRDRSSRRRGPRRRHLQHGHDPGHGPQRQQYRGRPHLGQIVQRLRHRGRARRAERGRWTGSATPVPAPSCWKPALANPAATLYRDRDRHPDQQLSRLCGGTPSFPVVPQWIPAYRPPNSSRPPPRAPPTAMRRNLLEERGEVQRPQRQPCQGRGEPGLGGWEIKLWNATQTAVLATTNTAAGRQPTASPVWRRAPTWCARRRKPPGTRPSRWPGPASWPAPTARSATSSRWRSTRQRFVRGHR